MAVQYYYLLSSLPFLRFGERPPISSEEFLVQLDQHLDEGSARAVAAVGLEPKAGGTTEAERYWNAFDTYVRNYVARARAAKLGRDAGPWLRDEEDVFPGGRGQLDEALGQSSPTHREKMLDDLRWRALDDVLVGREYEIDALVVYRIRLLIAEKWDAVSEQGGMESVAWLVSAADIQAREIRTTTDTGGA